MSWEGSNVDGSSVGGDVAGLKRSSDHGWGSGVGKRSWGSIGNGSVGGIGEGSGVGSDQAGSELSLGPGAVEGSGDGGQTPAGVGQRDDGSLDGGNGQDDYGNDELQGFQ